MVLAIQTPAIALTSDGKAPDLTEYDVSFADVLAKAAKAAAAARPVPRSEKDILYEVLPELMRLRSGDGQHTVQQEEHLKNEIVRVTKEIEEAAFRAYGRDAKVAQAAEALRVDEARRAKNRELLPQRLELGSKRNPARSWRTVLQGLVYKLHRLPPRTKEEQ